MDKEKTQKGAGTASHMSKDEKDYLNKEEFVRKWGHVPSHTYALKLVNNYQSMIIYGPPGCGKSTFVKDIVRELKVVHHSINCLAHNSMSKIIQQVTQHLITEVDLLTFKVKISSLDALISAVKIMKALTEQRERDPDSENVKEGQSDFVKELMTNSAYKVIYVLENVHCIKKDSSDNEVESELAFHELIEEILYKFNYLSKNAELNIGVVFVTQQPLVLSIPTINVPYASNHLLGGFILQSLVNHSKKTSFKYELEDLIPDCMRLQKNLSGLTGSIVRSLCDEVKQFNILRAIAEKSLDYCLKQPKVIKPQSEKAADIILVNRSEALMKFFINEPRAAFKPISEIITLVEKFHSIVEANKAQLASRSNAAAKARSKPRMVLDSEEMKYANVDVHQKTNKLPNIPALLLIACYVANVLPESKDAYLSQNIGALTGRGKAAINQHGHSLVEGKEQKRPASRERIEFWFQYFLSIVYSNDDAKLTRERELFHQSTDFSTTYRFLEDFRLILRHKTNSIDELSNIKFECKAERDRIEEMANNFGFKLGEYIGSKKPS